ncbi:hypothetical protein O0235_10610 [Tepidiforma flava]|uniref:Pentapeptide repeat-containing protein n=1 Tax=Tepidiforma flava TaxID=3004094 RepID=A0ABY7M4J3_9CHLR|nr:hypothetical protein [Tepidiforma flava]WBL35237.1 hypothetical protein O0235_10610 [Tepidiforma flava]
MSSGAEGDTAAHALDIAGLAGGGVDAGVEIRREGNAGGEDGAFGGEQLDAEDGGGAGFVGGGAGVDGEFAGIDAGGVAVAGFPAVAGVDLVAGGAEEARLGAVYFEEAFRAEGDVALDGEGIAEGVEVERRGANRC